MQTSHVSTPLAQHSATGLRIGVVMSQFNADITTALRDGALSALTAMGASLADCPVVVVAGAFEIPVVAQAMARQGLVDGIVCVGCLIRGDTEHYDHVCRTAADGIARVALDCGLPVGFGVLTVSTRAHAVARAGGEQGNMGAQTAAAVVDAVHAMRALSHK